MKEETIDFILIILLLSLIVIVCFAVLELRKEGFKCLGNPIGYGFDKASSIIGENVSCYCDGGVQIDSNGIYVKQSYPTNLPFKIKGGG